MSPSVPTTAEFAERNLGSPARDPRACGSKIHCRSATRSRQRSLRNPLPLPASPAANTPGKQDARDSRAGAIRATSPRPPHPCAAPRYAARSATGAVPPLAYKELFGSRARPMQLWLRQTSRIRSAPTRLDDIPRKIGHPHDVESRVPHPPHVVSPHRRIPVLRIITGTEPEIVHGHRSTMRPIPPTRRLEIVQRDHRSNQLANSCGCRRPAVTHDPCVNPEPTRVHRRSRRQTRRVGAMHVVKPHSLCRNGIHVRRSIPTVAVAAEAVRAEGVDVEIDDTHKQGQNHASPLRIRNSAGPTSPPPMS